MSSQSINVLHVDDEPDFADMAAEFLEREDARLDVETAAGAHAGLDRLAEADFDCVVSDYDMPRMNGIEFLERVRAESPDLPFILFTGKGSEEVASEAIRAGVTEYLQKGSDTSQYELLANRIENAVESYRTERRAELQRRQYRDFFEEAPVMYTVTRDDGGQLHVEDCNDRFLERLGYDREEVIDRPISDFYAEESKRKLHEEGGYEQALDGGFGIQERTLVAADGERVHVLNRANPRLDSQGTPIGAQAMYLDITERKERTRRLELAIEQTRSGVWEYDVESGMIVRHEGASGLWAEDTHTTVPIEDAIAERVHPEDQEAVWNAIEATVESSEPYHVEFRHDTPDGYRWVEARGELLREHDGDSGRLIALTTDIHAYKEREQRLRETTARLMALFEHSPDMINVHDAEGNIINPNPRLCEKTGYDEADLTDMKVWDIDRAMAPDEARTLWKGMETGDRRELEGRYEHRDGSTFPVEVHVRRLDLDGEDRFVAISRDISERKERERELELYETMLETVPDGVYALDEDLRYRVVNQGLADMLDYSKEELVGSHLSLVNDEEVVEKAKRQREQITTDEIDETMMVAEHPHLTADGEAVPTEVRFRALPPDEDGSFRGTAGVVRETSDRLERERELEEYREYTDRLLDAIDDVLSVQDEDGDFQRWNESLAEVTGYDDEELASMNGADIVPEEHRDRTAAAIQDVFEAGHARIEAPLVTEDGSEIPYEFVANRLEHPDGDPRMVGIGRDISERVEMEEQLREERNRLSALFDDAPQPTIEGSVESTDTYNIVDVNAAFEETFGYDADEIVGRDIADALVPADERAEHERFRERVANGESFSAEVERTTTDGERTFLIDVVSYGTESTPADGWFATYTDITERTEREMELELYETMLETVPDGVYVLDDELEFHVVNQGLADMLGYSKEELVGSHLSLISPDHAVESARQNREAIRNADGTVDDEIRVVEHVLITADGEEIACEVRFRALSPDEDGSLRGTAGVVRDVTEREEREQELQRERDRLDQFASTVSHDLRNPLNVAEGRLALARQECDSEHLDPAARALDRMDALIDDLLTLAREGTSVENPETVDLADVVDACWKNVDTADATLVVDTELMIDADRSRLAQLLENLMRNAVEHGGFDVTITVGDLDDGRGFYVADDGPGIRKNERERVFESGYSKSEDGTGFGLSIVGEIAEAHGWTVTLSESADGGARVEIAGVESVA